MIKRFLILTYIFLPVKILSQTQYGTAIECQKQYDMNVQAVMAEISPTLTLNQRNIAQAYIELVKQKEQTDAEILYMERTTIDNPMIQGTLKMPYDNYANCIELGLVNGETNNAIACDKVYAQDVISALNKAQCILNNQRTRPPQKIRETLQNAPYYMNLYKKRAIINAKLLVLERQTILNLAPLEGTLRKPYDVYDQCRAPQSIVPFRYNYQ